MLEVVLRLWQMCFRILDVQSERLVEAGKYRTNSKQRTSSLHLLLTVNTGKCILRFAMKHPVEQERGKRFVGVPEFAAVCERVMSELGLEQMRGTVTNVPD